MANSRTTRPFPSERQWFSLMKRLEELGWLFRQPVADASHEVHFLLTPSGREVMMALVSAYVVEQELQDSSAPLTALEERVLRRLARGSA